ncbi:hypothetical protein [Streptomyces acidiscabies]|uniref:Uncharacterized protein n=1 Tax=Streptomyces acidiscabies TaxID=42234 RepID=A0ABU4LXA1_9ACTN|nr:hypothetical protein [Streptomyces acidiscabies]MDX3020102.1 hypothetical protein [Streptomyces acidiscabies]
MADPKYQGAVTAATASAATKRWRARFRDNREPSTRWAASLDREMRRCRSDMPRPRDWPSKDDGAPHPPDAQGDDL